MRIGVIAPGGVSRDGVTRSTPSLVAMLEHLGSSNDVLVMLSHQEALPSEYLTRGIRVVCGGGSKLRTIAALMREHRTRGFDALFSFGPMPAPMLGAIARVVTGVPLCVHVGGGELTSLPAGDYGSRRRARGRFLARCWLDAASMITVPTDFMREVVGRLGRPAVLVPLGVSEDHDGESVPRTRSPAEPLRLVSVGGLRWVKGLDVLLRAVAAATVEGASVCLEVIGDGPLEAPYRQLVAELGIQARVRFRGWLAPAAVRDALAAAHALIVSSWHEGGPVVAVEAARAGLAVAGSRVGHIHDWEGRAALAADPGDVPGLTRIVLALHHDDNLRLRLAHSAQREARELTARKTASRLEDVLRTCAG